MLNRRLLGYRNMRLAGLMSFTFGTGFFAMSLGLVLFLTQVWDYSVVQAGARSSRRSRRRWCCCRRSPGAWPTISAIASSPYPRASRGVPGSLWLLEFVDETPDLARVWFPAMFLLGIGSGLAWPTIHGLPVIGTPSGELGSAVATNQTVLRVAGALGVAIAITLISGVTVRPPCPRFKTCSS
jgi:hypothetical protein